LGIGSSRLFLEGEADSGSFRTRNDFVVQCYGKVDIACQAITGLLTAQGSPARLDPWF
jgi:hypothetical protein